MKKHEVLLYGFGHRVYKNYDPRAKVIKGVVDEVLAVAGDNPLLAIAQELERIALEDDYFVSRKLYPNVDFYSGIAYRAIGFDPAAFTVLFGVGADGRLALPLRRADERRLQDHPPSPDLRRAGRAFTSVAASARPPSIRNGSRFAGGVSGHAQESSHAHDGL